MSTEHRPEDLAREDPGVLPLRPPPPPRPCPPANRAPRPPLIPPPIRIAPMTFTTIPSHRRGERSARTSSNPALTAPRPTSRTTTTFPSIITTPSPVVPRRIRSAPPSAPPPVLPQVPLLVLLSALLSVLSALPSVPPPERLPPHLPAALQAGSSPNQFTPAPKTTTGELITLAGHTSPPEPLTTSTAPPTSSVSKPASSTATKHGPRQNPFCNRLGSNPRTRSSYPGPRRPTPSMMRGTN